jgi:hypothetical protein
LNLFATEYIRRIRGGTHPFLMRCSDNNHYIIKFQNNPQGKRVLANDFLGALLAKRLGLSVAEPAVVDVSEKLVELSHGMTFTLRDTTVRCRPGLSFGSRYVCDDPQDATFIGSSEHANTFLTRHRMAKVTNLHEFVGMLVFDKWTSNSDSRQVVFARRGTDASWSAHMIDHGWCFGGAQWDFPDVLREGVCFSEFAYESITGIEDFEPWLNRVEHEIDEPVLEQLASQIPTEWYDHDFAALRKLVATLYRRRGRVRQLLLSTWEDYPKLFPSWIQQKSWRIGERTNTIGIQVSQTVTNAIGNARRKEIDSKSGKIAAM